MRTFQLSKFNPEFRTKDGKYLKNEWTSISDIGQIFDDGLLTSKEYLSVEANYILAIEFILRELNSENLKIVGLTDNDYYLEKEKFIPYDDSDDNLYENLKEGNILSIEASLRLLKLMIREKAWCYLVNDKITIRVGYDFYLNVTIENKLYCFNKIENDLNLFIIEFEDKKTSMIDDVIND